MTLRQTLEKSSAATNELFAKLINTSNQAVKTRETVLGELGQELRRIIELEEAHLFPVLRKHQETKELVPQAVQANKELLSALSELEALPKGDHSFIPQVTALRKLLQQHIRDERKELLPVVQKVLSDAEADAVVRKMETGAAEAEEQARVEAEERRAAAKADQKRAAEITAEQKVMAEALKAAEAAAEELATSAAEAVEAGSETAKLTSRRVVAGAFRAVSRSGRRVSEEAAETLSTYRGMAQDGGGDVKAVASAVRTLAQVGSEAGSLWLKSFARAGRNGLQTSFRLVRHPLSVVQTQREFVAETGRNLLETTSGLLEITRRASGAAARPIEQRLQAS